MVGCMYPNSYSVDTKINIFVSRILQKVGSMPKSYGWKW